MPHTSGPWERCQDTSGRDGISDGTQMVCVVTKRWTTKNADEWKANADLIAAAPDLLAACQTLIKYCSKRDGTLHAYHGWIEAFVEDGSTITEAVESAVAAIAKAEGRA